MIYEFVNLPWRYPTGVSSVSIDTRAPEFDPITGDPTLMAGSAFKIDRQLWKYKSVELTGDTYVERLFLTDAPKEVETRRMFPISTKIHYDATSDLRCTANVVQHLTGIKSILREFETDSVDRYMSGNRLVMNRLYVDGHTADTSYDSYIDDHPKVLMHDIAILAKECSFGFPESSQQQDAIRRVMVANLGSDALSMDILNDRPMDWKYLRFNHAHPSMGKLGYQNIIQSDTEMEVDYGLEIRDVESYMYDLLLFLSTLDASDIHLRFENGRVVYASQYHPRAIMRSSGYELNEAYVSSVITDLINKWAHIRNTTIVSVVKNWAEDVFITVMHVDGTSVTYYVDMCLFHLGTRQLVRY